MIVILAIIAAVVVVSLIVVFSRGTPPLRDESTPEGVVARYAAAVISGDDAVAGAYLADAAIRECDEFESGTTDNIRVTLVSTTERSNSADVKVVIITSFGDGPFGSSDYESEEVFDLVKKGSEWKINRTPYQLTLCTGR